MPVVYKQSRSGEMSSTSIKKRPYLTIECNWENILRSTGGQVWVTCKRFQEIGKHGNVWNVDTSSEGYPKVQASEGFRVINITKKTLNLMHEEPSCESLFVAPVLVFSDIHKKSIISLDVSLGGLGVSSSVDNKLFVWDTSNGEIRRVLNGHVWDVYSCRFFPSGIVVLSGGADMQLKIWSVETGDCPVTLRGHKAAITDTAIVDRGRNVISVSKDGTASLWDCGKSAHLDYIARFDNAINGCDISSVNVDQGHPDKQPSEREIGTEGKLLVLGCEDGSLHTVGIHSRKLLHSYKFGTAVNCCKFISSSQVICGTQDGYIHLFEIHDLSEPLVTWEESQSPVLCILPYQQGFFAGRSDGTCMFYSINSDNMVQLTGPNIEPIYAIAVDNIFLYTACRDAKIRKYKLPVVLI
ncbi:proteasomal ATPase-associated factor 1-like [Centruroides sculpturatus]|uniref:proteasomal ATPase-associated factor 1-like n=1 Tax=Centruroides sculpturatus TaxID=218467 RepID=UPI000C6EC3B0|nr:proteasomal ATPase-associated factor 1-like [Centruroides sculpturatus]